MRFIKNNSQDAARRGAVAVEFAFGLPIMLLLLLAVFNFGLAVWIKHSIEEALSITGRYATYHASASNSTLQTYFCNTIHAIACPNANLTFLFANSTLNGVSLTGITITYNFHPFSNFSSFYTITLTNSVIVPRIS